ncbi:MAG TPA: protease pro-enzyme activation domain-containing protein [Chthonomonas sp.]|jgi:kumamolisin|uniref:protease pro-enzyme activation domain-containing protein n=1 Tax=Chthonomonas sp. TaxID=2282153 RepID=UPI002B4B0EA5|nr:protease pro-enzyme activation domain-containing protein [Chthonomonas sp.]HLH81240.1 protease pro-enzyme activation domain-containing protein [Chthonomonas sp.]
MRDLLTKSLRHLVLLSSILALVLTAYKATGQMPLKRLPGHLPAIIARSTPVGVVPPTQPLHLMLVLQIPNQKKLDDYIKRIYTPNDPLYHHYLIPQQFGDMFGLSQADYNRVINWAKSQGFQVTQTYKNRLLLGITTSAMKAQNAFHVKLRQYTGPDGSKFYAPDSNPTAPPVPIVGIVGLDNAGKPKPLLQFPGGFGPPPTIGSPYPPTQGGSSNPIGTPPIYTGLKPLNVGTGPAGGLAPNDILTAYNLTSGVLYGNGQILGLVELDGYAISDIAQYITQFKLPNSPSLKNVLLDGFNGTPSGTGGQVEVTLDIDMMLALAYNASEILVYESPDNIASFLDNLAAIADDDTATCISCSWGLAEDLLPLVVLIAQNYTFAQMAAQGQSFFTAAGDNGAFDDGSTLSVDSPADQPFVTGVGGTTLFTNGPGGAYVSETVWNNDVIDGGGGGGGGISIHWAIPSYQAGFISPASLGSPALRNVPDVTLDADPNTGYDIYVASFGGWFTVGGTSAAAPLWAAFTADVNAGRAKARQPLLGFVNPILYNIAQDSTKYANDFHDITTGNNGFYPAVSGYDDASGLGSFNGANLYAELVQPPPPTNLIGNPGFENGFDPSPWIATPGVISDSLLEPPHSGYWDAWLCGYPLPHTDMLQQTITIPSPANTITLSFYLHIDTANTATTPVDTLQVEILDINGKLIDLVQTFSNLNANTGYTQETFSLPTSLAGQTVILRLVGTQTTFAPTSFVVDDFSLTVQ